MSTETHVFFRGKLPGKAALARMMRDFGFPFTLKPATGSLEQQDGFMLMTFRRQETGVEFDVFEGRAAIDEFGVAGVDQTFDRVANFRWGGDEMEAAAGMCAAAALAKLVKGVVFDEAEDKLLTVEKAASLARRALPAVLSRTDKVRAGTRPADIKRYLGPLLEMRKDLALVGRRLVIRPIRHIARGVFFDRTSDRYQFRISRQISPLFLGEDGFSAIINDGMWKVYEPCFATFLFDVLAEDVFSELGQITSMTDLADALREDKYSHTTRVTALLLAGERDSAVTITDDLEREKSEKPYYRDVVKQSRSLLMRDIGELCAELHTQEADAIKKLNLGDMWEPARFPVEAPDSRQEQEIRDPVFVVTPWIERPSDLWEYAPQQEHAPRYALAMITRKQRPVLWKPICEAEAKERHDTYQDYAFAYRLSDTQFAMVRSHSGRDPHSPEFKDTLRYYPRDFHVHLFHASGCVRAFFMESYSEFGILRMLDIELNDAQDRHSFWSGFNDMREKSITLRDYSPGGNSFVKRQMTDSDLGLCRFPVPRFGDFPSLYRKITAYLGKYAADLIDLR